MIESPTLNEASMRVESVPEPTLRRLPSYHGYLLRLREKGQTMISASQIGADLGVHHTQVRKDLAFTGSEGRPKVGHRIDDLLSAIEEFLNWNNTTEAFLIGAGRLGAALLGEASIEKAGVKIVAAFDISSRKVGQSIQGVRILPLEKFQDLTQRMHIAIGILAVPLDVAQEVAELMARSGIQAIWNLVPIELDLPDNIIVENLALHASLAVLSRRLAVKHKAAEGPASTI
jgi:redox-sensing transcriptional repressor